jgi:hypothetical protein
MAISLGFQMVCAVGGIDRKLMIVMASDQNGRAHLSTTGTL